MRRKEEFKGGSCLPSDDEFGGGEEMESKVDEWVFVREIRGSLDKIGSKMVGSGVV